MEKKLAEYKCDTNEAISLKLGMFMFALSYTCFQNQLDNILHWQHVLELLCSQVV